LAILVKDICMDDARIIGHLVTAGASMSREVGIRVSVQFTALAE
jgi:hypothetical protein